VSAAPGRLVLLGHPVGHSASPGMQGAALAAARIPVRYEALDVPPDRLTAVLDELTQSHAGGNVTVPHKEAVALACGRLTPEAERVGAVNTFAVRDSVLVGHNTDIAGFDRAARTLLDAAPINLTVGVFGAGGAAAAVLAAIESWPRCTAILANRHRARAVALCERFRSVARVGDADEIASGADLVVNATTLGLRSENGPIDPARLRRATAVLDLVYSSSETRFVHAARARGLRAADGLSMLVFQGAEAFAWWFGLCPDEEVMWRATGRSPNAAA
jgi:shikimate dehydrogenase